MKQRRRTNYALVDQETLAPDRGTEKWLTKGELAKYLRYSERWVEIRVREGMPHLRIGGQPRFRISEVEAYFRAQESAR